MNRRRPTGIIHLTLRVRGRPVSSRTLSVDAAAAESPVPVTVRRGARGLQVDTPGGPEMLDPAAVFTHGDVVAEVSFAPRAPLPRALRRAIDLVFITVMLAASLLGAQLALLMHTFGGGGAPAGGLEPTPEYLARLLEEQFDGAEEGAVARLAERPIAGEKIESFYLPAGQHGPIRRLGGGQDVAAERRDAPPPEQARPAEERAPDAEAAPAPPETPAESARALEPLPAEVPRARGQRPALDPLPAVEVNEGWGLSDWYDTQDARADAEEIRGQLTRARELLRLDPDDPDGLNLRGYYEFLAMDYEAARATYQRLTELYPEEGAAWNNLGLTYKRQARYAEEEALYRVALQLEPDNDYVLNNLAVCLAHQGRYDEALALMERLETLIPDDPYADLHRAKIWAARGNEARAYHFLRKSLRTMRTLDTLHNIEFRQDIRLDPAFATLREQPRFRQLLSSYYGDRPGGWWNPGKARSDP